MDRGSTFPSRAMIHAALAVAALVFLLPLAWMVVTALKTEEQAAAGTIAILPDPLSGAPAQGLANVKAVWEDPSVTFPVYLRNTLIVAILSVAGMTLSSAWVAYGLA
ncbi:MAG: hypothetical protein ACT4PL_14075, partial [Phycisphaerales bacterium]